MRRASGASRVRRAAALGLAAALLLGQAACSGDPIESYCDDLREESPAVGAAAEDAGSTQEALLDLLPTLRDLADAAPRDIADDWELLVSRVEGLRTALADADVDPATYDPEDPPDGLDADAREAITRAGQRLVEADLLRAVQSVQQQALDVCQVTLGL